jgi:hypothetical protein
MLTEMTDAELEKLWFSFKQGEPGPGLAEAHGPRLSEPAPLRLVDLIGTVGKNS